MRIPNPTLTLTLAIGIVLVASAIPAATAALVQTGSLEIDPAAIGERPGRATPAAPALVEHLANPGFEDGILDPWITNSCSWGAVAIAPHAGAYAAYDIGNNWIRQDFPPVDTAVITSVTFWARQPEGGAMAVDFFYSDDTFDEDVVAPGSAWAQFDVTSFLRPPGNVLVAIRVWGYSGGGPGPDETYADDFSIQVGVSAAPAAKLDDPPATAGGLQPIRTGSLEIDPAAIGERPRRGAPVEPALAEQLVNPGFEDGSLEPWYTNPCMWRVVAVTPHAGVYAAYDLGNNWIRQDFPPLDTGMITSVTFWARQPDVGAMAVDFIYSDATYDEDVIFPGPDWAQFDVTSFLRPAGNLLVAMRVWGYSGGGGGPDETYADDFSIQVTGPAGIPDPHGQPVVTPSSWGRIKSQYGDAD